MPCCVAAGWFPLALRAASVLGCLSPHTLSSPRPGRWREGVISLSIHLYRVYIVACIYTRGYLEGDLPASMSGIATPRSGYWNEGCCGSEPGHVKRLGTLSSLSEGAFLRHILLCMQAKELWAHVRSEGAFRGTWRCCCGWCY